MDRSATAKKTPSEKMVPHFQSKSILCLEICMGTRDINSLFRIFYVSLTVHRSITLDNDQLNAQIF